MDASRPRAEGLLREELTEAPSSNERLIELFSTFSPEELASLFVSGAFLRSILKPLIDQDWLRLQRNDVTSIDERPKQMLNELRSLAFLKDELVNATAQELKAYFNRTTHLMQVLISFVQSEPVDRYRAFTAAAMRLIDERARELDLFPNSPFSEAMYRAFDQMDEIFGIHYELDRGMTSDPAQRERLYEGAGIGVQTSYSSILLALDRASITQGARVLDLGSGYGRVGFVLGLLRPDIDFTGYEYVDHRVRDSISVAERTGLTKTAYVTQDLSTCDLPKADVYYMYDPFSRETYAHVLNQLIAFGATSPVTIITKGRANTWVREALQSYGWSIDETCDSGTVCLFRSHPETTSTFV